MRTTLAYFTLASLTTATALGVASCQQAPWAGAPAPRAHTGPLWNEPQFTTMLQIYREKLHGKRRALRFEMSERNASLQVQDTAAPANVHSYDYKEGALRGPSPVNLTGVLQDPELDDNLFDWDQVAVERIPALVKMALTQTKLAGARVVQVKITRKAPSSDDIARRIDDMTRGTEMLVEARIRAMEQKIRRAERGFVDDEPTGGKNTQPSGSIWAPLDAIEIYLLLQAPGGFGWLTADASGTITGSGIDRKINGLPVNTDCAPYWRRAAGLCG
jgi:hypothetical protein